MLFKHKATSAGANASLNIFDKPAIGPLKVYPNILDTLKRVKISRNERVTVYSIFKNIP